MYSVTSRACFYCRLNFQATKLSERRSKNNFVLKHLGCQFCHEGRYKSQVSSCCSVLIFEIIVFSTFRRKYIQQFLSEELKVLYKSLMFSFRCLLLCFWYSCIFFKFFLNYFASQCTRISQSNCLLYPMHLYYNYIIYISLLKD